MSNRAVAFEQAAMPSRGPNNNVSDRNDNVRGNHTNRDWT
jgi:hypothetical protein